jgi:hypothetical protein
MKKVTEQPAASQAAALPSPLPRILDRHSVNLLAGAPNVGKTCLLAWLLTQLRDSQPLFGLPTVAPPAIAIISADRGWETGLEWFTKAGFPEIPCYSLTNDDAFNVKRLRRHQDGVKILEECLDKLGDLPAGTLVAVDPVAPFLGEDLNAYRSCMVACLEVRKVAKARDLILLGTAHSGKQKGDSKERYTRLTDRMLGSTALAGYTDTQFYLASPEEGNVPYYTFLYHSHRYPKGECRFTRDTASGLFIPYEGEGEAVEQVIDHAVILTPEMQVMLEQIPQNDDGISFTSLVELTQAPRTTVHRYLQQFVLSGQVLRFKHGCYRRTTPS